MAMNKPCECTGCRDPQVATIHGMDGSYLNVCRRHADMVDAARRSEWQSAPMVDANGHASYEMYLHSRCHPRTPTWAVLGGGFIRIECAECQKEIATFDLAPERADI